MGSEQDWPIGPVNVRTASHRQIPPPQEKTRRLDSLAGITERTGLKEQLCTQIAHLIRISSPLCKAKSLGAAPQSHRSKFRGEKIRERRGFNGFCVFATRSPAPLQR